MWICMVKEKEFSIWQRLNSWLYDGSASSCIPVEVRDSKEIGPQYIIWFFKDSSYNIYINSVFNNYDVYKLDKNECLKFLKQCVLKTGFRPRFIPKQRDPESKISKILKLKYPYFKKNDIELLVSIIDKSDEKDQIYETLGLYNPKKTKSTNEIKKQINEFVNETKKEEQKIGKIELFLQEFVIERK